MVLKQGSVLFRSPTVESLNPTVVVLKRHQPGTHLRRMRRLNPTVVVLKHLLPSGGGNIRKKSQSNRSGFETTCP